MNSRWDVNMFRLKNIIKVNMCFEFFERLVVCLFKD
jgi:hypothetical protein